MGYVKHVGRVGALAVALGVGAAAAGTPAIGYAAPSDAGSATTDSATTDSDSPAGGQSASTQNPHGAQPSAVPSSGESAPAKDVDERPAPEAADTTDAGSGTGANRQDSAENDAGSAASPEPQVTAGSTNDPLWNRRDDSEGKSPVMHPADQKPSTTNPAGAYSALDPALTNEQITSTAESPAEPIEPLPPLTIPAAPFATTQRAGNTSAVPNTGTNAPAAAAVGSQDLTHAMPDLIGGVVSVVTGVPASALAPFTTVIPQDPRAPSAALWTMLAWTRREVGITGQNVFDGVGAVINGVATLFDRMFNIYDLSDWRGWAALVLDYTWVLPTTMAGNAVHVVNTFFWPDSGYRYDLSFHQHHAVYEGGYASNANGLNSPAMTLGNVISNAAAGETTIDAGLLIHEDVHVWQQRIFGPLQPLTYGAWYVGATLGAAIIWLSDTSLDWDRLFRTVVYYDNPWESWAKRVENAWPPVDAYAELLLW